MVLAAFFAYFLPLLAGRRREGTRTDRARAQAGGHRAVLGLNVHVLAVQGAILHEIAQPLDHDGLRGDGVSGDHMGLRLTHGQRDCLVAGNKQLLARIFRQFSTKPSNIPNSAAIRAVI